MFDLELIPGWEAALAVSAATGLVATLVVRLIQKADAAKTAVTVVEGTSYAALGALGGLLGALFFMYVLPAKFFAIVAFALAVMCAAGIVLGLLHGTGGAARKAIGIVVYAVLGVLLVLGGLALWDTGDDVSHVVYVASFLAATGASMGISFAVYRSAHWALGWLLAFVNGSWGALGTLTGILLHVGTWTFFSPDPSAPSPGAARVLPNSERRFFHCWQNGMRVMPQYFFSQGPVMTAWTAHGMWHEAVHVFQHYVFGPLMPISYVAWAAVMGLVGAIVGLVTGHGIVHGAFAWAYVNNPWEVWEYNSAWGSSSPTPRAVSSTVVKPGKSATDLVFGNGLAWPLTVAWILLWVVGFVLLVVFAGGRP